MKLNGMMKGAATRMATVIVLLTAALAFSAMAQNTVTVTKLPAGGKLIEVTQLVTGTATVNSPLFTLDGYLENTSLYPKSVQYSLDTSNQNAGVDVDSVSSVIQATNNFSDATPIFSTVDTLSMTLGTTAATFTTIDLNGVKAAYYRIQSKGLGANTGALIKWKIYCARKDH